MPFAATWMDIEIILLGELRQRKTNIIWYHLYVSQNKWYKWTYLQDRSITDIEDKHVYKRENMGGSDKLGDWG